MRISIDVAVTIDSCRFKDHLLSHQRLHACNRLWRRAPSTKERSTLRAPLHKIDVLDSSRSLSEFSIVLEWYLFAVMMTDSAVSSSIALQGVFYVEVVGPIREKTVEVAVPAWKRRSAVKMHSRISSKLPHPFLSAFVLEFVASFQVHEHERLLIIIANTKR